MASFFGALEKAKIEFTRFIFQDNFVRGQINKAPMKTKASYNPPIDPKMLITLS